jgi:hypothetical protein
MLAVEESDSTLLLRLGGDFDLAGVGQSRTRSTDSHRLTRHGASSSTYDVLPSSTRQACGRS